MRQPETKITDAVTHGRRAVIELREKIVNGELVGGMRLFEVSLAEKLEISRTPVREALSRLAEEGLLERLPNGGFVVRRFDYNDVVDAIELRGVMEGMAARLAAERGIAPGELAAVRETLLLLDGCFGSVQDDVDFEAYSQLNARFHDQVSRLAGSDLVRREIERVSSLPFASPSAFTSSKMRISAFWSSLRLAQAQHHELIKAIAAREGSRAEAIAREHARIARNNLEYILDEDPSVLDKIPGLANLRR